MKTPLSALRTLPFLAAALLAAVFLSAVTARAETEQTASADIRDSYKQISLAELVPATRMTDGSRAIFQPQPTRFRAKLARLPVPQKSDYLKKVIAMMGVAGEMDVEQSVVLDYGGDKPLAAYVEKKAAERISAELKAGDERTFYAFHVYNNRYGPALVITSFED